jgi:hypothetical protein
MFESILRMMPEHLRDSLTPENLMQRLHGMSDGDPCWACGCEVVTTVRCADQCEHCDAWFPRRCNTQGCGTYVHPKGSTHYDQPHHLCRKCETQGLSQSRVDMLDTIPSSVLGPAVKDYWKLPHREELDRRMAAWIKGGGFANLYVKGSCGTGKTVAAARAAHFLVERGKVDSIMWCREYDMVQWAKSRWKNDGIGEENIRRATDVHLLVIDEMFFRPSSDEGTYHTEKERAALADLFCKRFEDISKRTIMVSNERPMFSGVYDRRAMSRFEGSTEYIEVKGHDLRRRGNNASK